MIPGVPSQAQATAQISQGLQNQGFDPSQANQIAQDITNTATWGDITAAQAMQKALQGGNSTLSPGQMGAVHNFINRLPTPDRAPLDRLVKKYCPG